MSVETTPTVDRDDVTTSSAAKPGPVLRIIAASLATGAAAALVLSMVVFAGGTEAVITGSLLVGFGLGWAMLAALSVRRTNQPQRWAVLPAAAMTVSGIALVALDPADAAMTRLTWVWPPLVLALAVWMLVRMRRALTGKGRWLLTPVIVVLGLTAVGAGYENVAARQDHATYTAPGTSYLVDGHRLHLDCRGQGSPTVVLANGLGEVSASWARIAGPVAETTRVCAYDRAGQGWSEDADGPQDGVTAAKELHALLAAAGESGPYVLVGHSIGGPYAMTYAARYPDQVAGLVLLDSSSPEQFTSIPSYPGQYAVMRRVVGLTPTVSRVGLGGLLTGTHLPAAEAAQVEALTSTARGASNMRDELSVLRDVFGQAQALTTMHGRPVAVVTASDTLSTGGWAAAQDRLAALSANSVRRTVTSSHEGLLEDEVPSAESVRAITEVIAAVRTGIRLDTP